MTGRTADEVGVDERPFDELVAELQRVVQALETGSAGLEDSIELYRRGLVLHAACEKKLRAAELTITELGRKGASAAEPTAGGSGEAG